MCEGKRYIRVICGGTVVVCGDTEEEVEQAAESAMENDPRCRGQFGDSGVGGSGYAN